MVLRELLAVFGIKVEDQELKKGAASIEELIGTAKKAGAALAGAFLVKEIFDFTSEVANSELAMERAGRTIGLSAAQMEKWQFAAEMSGVSAETLAGAFGTVQRNAFQAAQGGQAQADAFRQVGVSILDTNGQLKGSNQLMLDVADGLSRVANPTKRTALSMLLLGRSGKDLQPLLDGGAEGVVKLQESMLELDEVATDAELKLSKDFVQAGIKSRKALEGLKKTIAFELMPVVLKLGNAFISLIKWFKAATKGSYFFKAALIVLGAVMTAMAIKTIIAFAPIIGMFILAAAAALSLALIIDEIITTAKGGTSIFTEFIDALRSMGPIGRAIAAPFELIRDALIEAADAYAFITGTDSPHARKQAADVFAATAAADEKRSLEDQQRRRGGSTTSRTAASGNRVKVRSTGLAMAPPRTDDQVRADARATFRSVAIPGGQPQAAGAGAAGAVNLTINAPNAKASEVAEIAVQKIKAHQAAARRQAMRAVAQE